MISVFLLVTSTSAFVFQCKFAKLYWGILAVRYTCEDANVTMLETEEDRTLTGVAGHHLSEKTYTDVGALMVNNDSKLDRLPKNLDYYFPYLVALLWTHGNIQTITAEDLEPLLELTVLVLSNNKIVALDGDLFKHSHKLVVVEFNDNLIERIGKGFMLEPSDLESANFQGNVCVDTSANSYQEVKTLRFELPKKCPWSVDKSNSSRINTDEL